MPSSFERALFGVIDHASVIFKRDNAVVSISAHCVIGGIAFLVAAYLMPASQALLVKAGIGMFAVPIIAWFYFAIRNPDRLQSEKFQLNQARLQKMAFAKELSRPLSAEELPPPVPNPSQPPPAAPPGDEK